MILRRNSDHVAFRRFLSPPSLYCTSHVACIKLRVGRERIRNRSPALGALVAGCTGYNTVDRLPVSFRLVSILGLLRDFEEFSLGRDGQDGHPSVLSSLLSTGRDIAGCCSGNRRSTGSAPLTLWSLLVHPRPLGYPQRKTMEMLSISRQMEDIIFPSLSRSNQENTPVCLEGGTWLESVAFFAQRL